MNWAIGNCSECTRKTYEPFDDLYSTILLEHYENGRSLADCNKECEALSRKYEKMVIEQPVCTFKTIYDEEVYVCERHLREALEGVPL